MSKFIKELTKEWKEYKGKIIYQANELPPTYFHGLDGEVIEVSPPQLRIVSPSFEGFMDYLANKQ